MSIQLRLIAAAVTVLAMSQASAQTYPSPGSSNYGNGYGYGHSRAVRCESINSRRTLCRVDTRGGVRITRQLSQRSCIQGRTWASNSQGIWVSNGCRADFAITSTHHSRYGNGYDSNRYSRNDGRYGNDNAYTYSNGQSGDYRDRDEQNRDYRNGNDGYYDRNGDAGYGSGSNFQGQIIRCESTNDGRTYCRNESNGNVRLDRTYSGNCTEGRTWGSDQRGIWVSGDCDAGFNIGEDANYDSDYQP